MALQAPAAHANTAPPIPSQHALPPFSPGVGSTGATSGQPTGGSAALATAAASLAAGLVAAERRRPRKGPAVARCGYNLNKKIKSGQAAKVDLGTPGVKWKSKGGSTSQAKPKIRRSRSKISYVREEDLPNVDLEPDRHSAGGREKEEEEAEYAASWKPGEPVEIQFREVSWTPPVEGAGERGRAVAKPVLDSVSWELYGTEKIGLIGANGSGKSTQLLMLLGEEEPTGGKIFTRPPQLNFAYMRQEANLDGEMTAYEELRSVFGDRRLEEIDADIEAASIDPALMDDSGDALTQLLDERANTEANLERLDALILELGLTEYKHSLNKLLSGGWQMRVGLAKIILSDPDVILLDEPTNHVDLETVEVMEAFLQSQSIPMVIVSHDRYFLNQVCSKIVEISRGCTQSYDGNYVDYLKSRDRAIAAEWRLHHRYIDQMLYLNKQIRNLEEKMRLEQATNKRIELQKLIDNPVPKPEVNEVRDFVFPSTLALREESAAEEEAAKEAEALPSESAAEQESGEEAAGVPLEPSQLLSVKDLSVRYGDNKVLNRLSFSIARGEKVAVVGPNGCGKSTLIKAIMKDLGAGGQISGSIDLPLQEAAYFPQRLAEAFNTQQDSVKDVLYLSCRSEQIERAGGLDAVLERLRLDGITKEQPVCHLSGGEKARVAFASFLLQPTAVLLLDEPTNHLDILTRELLEDALKEFDGAALVVSHDRFFLREFATRVLEIDHQGRLRDFDSWEAYKGAAPPQWADKEEKEVDFIKQDATVKFHWEKKKLARLRKRMKGNVGIRRLSTRVDEFAVEEVKRKPRQQLAAEALVAKGVNKTLLADHYYDEDEEDWDGDVTDDEFDLDEEEEKSDEESARKKVLELMDSSRA